METEKLKIFDSNKNEIGIATRKEVHQFGHWHETFHCWFVSREDDVEYIYFQLRSPVKKEYPNLLDITAAGHILAKETVEDGIREIKEELGIEVSFDKLCPLGIFDCSLQSDHYIDNEFCHVFLYFQEYAFNDFKLQHEEVAGMFKAEFKSFCDLWMDKREEIEIEGFRTNGDGKKEEVKQMVGKSHFTPNSNSYYEKLVTKCQAFFMQLKR